MDNPLDIGPLFSLRHASKECELPPLRNGKPPNWTTWIRWHTDGIGGVKLKARRIGGTLCTTRAAANEFFDALTATPIEQHAKESVRAAAKARARQHLDSLGLKKK